MKNNDHKHNHKYTGKVNSHEIQVLKDGSPLPLYYEKEKFSDHFCWGLTPGATKEQKCRETLGNYQLAFALLADVSDEEKAEELCIRFGNSIFLQMEWGKTWQFSLQDIKKIEEKIGD